MKHVTTKNMLAPDDDEERDETAPNGRFTSERAKAIAKRSRLAMSDLPQYLEKVTGRGLRVIDAILKLPLDEENGPLIRAQVTAALGVVSSQLRADEARLKRKATGDALQRLLKVIEQERALLEDRRAHKASVPVSSKDAEGADHAAEIPHFDGIDGDGK